MDRITNFSSKTWCDECRRYIADPSEVGMESDGICPHYGWALVKPSENELEDGSDVFPKPVTSSEPEESILEKRQKPLLGQSGGILAQSVVGFAHEHEQAATTDPGVHRQKDAVMIGTLVGVLLGLLAVLAFFVYAPQGKFTAGNGSGDIQKSADSDKGTGRVVKTREDVVGFIDEISRIDDVDKLLEVIRFPELLEPLVRARHEALGTDLSALEGLSILNYSEASRFGSHFGAVSLGRSDGKQIAVLLVEIADDGELLIDWEVLVGAGQYYWREFCQTQPNDGVPLWVSMHRTSIVDAPLPTGEDAEQWMAVKVMGPASGSIGTVHLTLVKKGDAFGDYVEKNIPWNTAAPNGRVMAVTAHFTSGLSPMLMIDELRAPGQLRSPTDDNVFPLAVW